MPEVDVTEKRVLDKPGAVSKLLLSFFFKDEGYTHQRIALQCDFLLHARLGRVQRSSPKTSPVMSILSSKSVVIQ